MIPCAVDQVFLKYHNVDFRKGFDGLLGECYQLGLDPYSGHCVVFIKKDRTQLRALIGDEYGLFLILRRFEQGRISIPWIAKQDELKTSISIAELGMLFEGVNFIVKKRIKKWRSKK